MLKKLIPTAVILILALMMLSSGCIINNPVPATQTPTATSTPFPTATQFVPSVLEQGSTLEISRNGDLIQISIDGKRFGQDALDILAKGSVKNPAPIAGEEAVLLKLKTKYISGAGASFVINPDSYEIYVKGVGHDAVSVVLPDEYKTLTKTNILKNAEYSAWLVYFVPKGENEDFGYDVNEEPLGFIKVNY
ncbi:MAG: hypothetical protein Q4Q53_07130 [Methanocorpusculum sp.]|nr:hypothetical protein [Methanocorpusculum sp.]